MNINDYKEYPKIYSSIEVEIIPLNNKYGYFINIDKKDKFDYHIYFNNNKEKIKKTYFTIEDKVEKIKILINHEVKSFIKIFHNYNSIKSISFKKFNRNNINNMSYMFYGCESLQEINLSKFNTDNVTNMKRMFSDSKSLRDLNLSKFNTNNVTNMHLCSIIVFLLKELNLFNFYSNIENMSFMLENCSSLKKINPFNFDTNNVKDMRSMFN